MWFARLFFVLCVLPAASHAADCALKPPRPSFVQIDYKGECRGGFAHGRGVALFQVLDQTKDDVIRQEGEFVDGVAHGRSAFSSQSGRFGFQGEFRNWFPYTGVAFQPSSFGRTLEVTYRNGEIVRKEYKSKDGGSSSSQVAQQPTGPNPLAMLLERALNKELQKRETRKQNEEQERQQRTQQVSPPVAMQDWGKAGGSAPVPASEWMNAPNGPKPMAKWDQIGGTSPVSSQEWGRRNDEDRAKWQQEENSRRNKEAEALNAANLAQQRAFNEANARERVEFARKEEQNRIRWQQDEDSRRSKEAAALQAANLAQQQAVQAANLAQQREVDEANRRSREEFAKKEEQNRIRWQQQSDEQKRKDEATRSAADRAQELARRQSEERSQAAGRNQAEETNAQYARQAAQHQAAESERLRLQQGEQQRPEVTSATSANATYGASPPVANSMRSTSTQEQRMPTPSAVLAKTPATSVPPELGTRNRALPPPPVHTQTLPTSSNTETKNTAKPFIYDCKNIQDINKLGRRWSEQERTFVENCKQQFIAEAEAAANKEKWLGRAETAAKIGEAAGNVANTVLMFVPGGAAVGTLEKSAAAAIKGGVTAGAKKEAAEAAASSAAQQSAATLSKADSNIGSAIGRTNKLLSREREKLTEAELRNEFPNASIQNERMLRNADGSKAIDPTTNVGRRPDHVVIEDGKVEKMIETTSRTANKKAQIEKEVRIFEQGPVYVRDKQTGELIKVDKPSEIRRQP